MTVYMTGRLGYPLGSPPDRVSLSDSSWPCMAWQGRCGWGATQRGHQVARPSAWRTASAVLTARAAPASKATGWQFFSFCLAAGASRGMTNVLDRRGMCSFVPTHALKATQMPFDLQWCTSCLSEQRLVPTCRQGRQTAGETVRRIVSRQCGGPAPAGRRSWGRRRPAARTGR